MPRRLRIKGGFRVDGGHYCHLDQQASRLGFADLRSCLHTLLEDGWSISQLATYLGTTQPAIRRAIADHHLGQLPRREQLARHPALGGPELEFLQAQLAYQRGDVSSARSLVQAALQRLPGHQDFLDFASEIGAPRPSRAQQIIEERSPSAGSLPPRASNRLPSVEGMTA